MVARRAGEEVTWWRGERASGWEASGRGREVVGMRAGEEVSFGRQAGEEVRWLGCEQARI